MSHRRVSTLFPSSLDFQLGLVPQLMNAQPTSTTTTNTQLHTPNLHQRGDSFTATTVTIEPIESKDESFDRFTDRTPHTTHTDADGVERLINYQPTQLSTVNYSNHPTRVQPPTTISSSMSLHISSSSMSGPSSSSTTSSAISTPIRHDHESMLLHEPNYASTSTATSSPSQSSAPTSRSSSIGRTTTTRRKGKITQAASSRHEEHDEEDESYTILHTEKVTFVCILRRTSAIGAKGKKSNARANTNQVQGYLCMREVQSKLLDALPQYRNRTEQSSRSSIRQELEKLHYEPAVASKSEIAILKAQKVIKQNAPGTSLYSVPQVSHFLHYHNLDSEGESLRQAFADWRADNGYDWSESESSETEAAPDRPKKKSRPKTDIRPKKASKRAKLEEDEEMGLDEYEEEEEEEQEEADEITLPEPMAMVTQEPVHILPTPVLHANMPAPEATHPSQYTFISVPSHSAPPVRPSEVELLEEDVAIPPPPYLLSPPFSNRLSHDFGSAAHPHHSHRRSLSNRYSRQFVLTSVNDLFEGSHFVDDPHSHSASAPAPKIGTAHQPSGWHGLHQRVGSMHRPTLSLTNSFTTNNNTTSSHSLNASSNLPPPHLKSHHRESSLLPSGLALEAFQAQEARSWAERQYQAHAPAPAPPTTAPAPVQSASSPHNATHRVNPMVKLIMSPNFTVPVSARSLMSPTSPIGHHTSLSPFAGLMSPPPAGENGNPGTHSWSATALAAAHSASQSTSPPVTNSATGAAPIYKRMPLSVASGIASSSLPPLHSPHREGHSFINPPSHSSRVDAHMDIDSDPMRPISSRLTPNPHGTPVKSMPTPTNSIGYPSADFGMSPMTDFSDPMRVAESPASRRTHSHSNSFSFGRMTDSSAEFERFSEALLDLQQAKR